MVNSLISGVENKPKYFTDMLIPSYKEQTGTNRITLELNLCVPVNPKPILENGVKSPAGCGSAVKHRSRIQEMEV